LPKNLVFGFAFVCCFLGGEGSAFLTFFWASRWTPQSSVINTERKWALNILALQN
jgi:hypothetical protein